MLFCTISSVFYSILQQPDCFFKNKTHLNQLRIINYPCLPSLVIIHKLVSKIYHLLQIMLFCRIFSVFCSILQQPDNFFLSKTYQNQLGSGEECTYYHVFLAGTSITRLWGTTTLFACLRVVGTL